jgi:alkylation response protein AidB-like acyl-CoA dehydrogenase
MDFTLSNEEASLSESIQRFTAAEYGLSGRAVLIEANRDNWSRLAEQGWLGVGIPEAAGGSGGSLSSAMIVAERLGAGLAVEPYIGSLVFVSQVLQGLLGEVGAAALLRPVVSGQDRLAMACSEQEARGGLRRTRATAVPCEGGYLLSGRKVAAAGGGRANAYLVSARTSGDSYDPGGISVFRVERGAPGLKVRPWRMIDGSDIADIELDGVEISESALIGKPGAALGALAGGLDTAICASTFEVVGVMEEILTATARHLRANPQHASQVARHRCADMLIEVEQARSAALRGLASLYQPNGMARAYATSAAKAVVIRTSRAVCEKGIEVHDGIEAAEDSRIAHLFRKASASMALYGSLDFHLGRMASAM